MNSDRKTWIGALLILVYLLIAVGVIVLVLHLTGGTAEAEGLRIMQVQARGGLNVRAAPNVGAKAVYLLEDCTTVVALESRYGWYRVAFNTPPHNEIGWVCGDYLK